MRLNLYSSQENLITNTQWDNAINTYLFGTPSDPAQQSLSDLLAAFELAAPRPHGIFHSLNIDSKTQLHSLLYSLAKNIIIKFQQTPNNLKERYNERAYTIIEDLLLADQEMALTSDNRNISLFMLAVNAELDNIAELLIRYGADIDQKCCVPVSEPFYSFDAFQHMDINLSHSMDVKFEVDIPMADSRHPDANYKVDENAAMLALRKGYSANLVAKLLTDKNIDEVAKFLETLLNNDSSQFLVDSYYHQRGIKHRTTLTIDGRLIDRGLNSEIVTATIRHMKDIFIAAKVWRNYYTDLRSYYAMNGQLLAVCGVAKPTDAAGKKLRETFANIDDIKELIFNFVPVNIRPNSFLPVYVRPKRQKYVVMAKMALDADKLGVRNQPNNDVDNYIINAPDNIIPLNINIHNIPLNINMNIPEQNISPLIFKSDSDLDQEQILLHEQAKEVQKNAVKRVRRLF